MKKISYKYRLTILILFTSLALTTTILYADEDDKNVRTEESIKLENIQQIKKIDSLFAINYYETSYDISSAYADRAYYKLNINDSLDALEDCCQALQVDSTTYYAYYLMALYYGKHRAFQESINITDLGMRNCNSKRMELYRIKANSTQGLGNYNQALSMYNELIENDSEEGSNYYNKSTILLMERRYDKAIELLDKALDLYKAEKGNDYKTSAYNNIAYAYLLKKNLDKALKNYTIAQSLEEDIDTYIGLCLVYYLLNNEEKLDENFKLALQLRPNLKDGMQEIKNMTTNENYFYSKESLVQLDTIFSLKLK